MSTQMFVNLPVEDLDASRAFYTALGYTVDENFSGDQNITVAISDTLYLVLLVKPYFSTYITTEIADARKSTEVMLGLTADDRDGVDTLFNRAIAAGGTVPRDTIDHGFMYTRSFLDPDGHFWEIFWMDQQAAQDGPPESFVAEHANA